MKPYQPLNVWEAVASPYSNTATYQQDTGDALYRRSLYTFWKRQAPPPSLELFNAPSREQSSVQRERTNTPLQALVTLNDVQFVEAARVLATHALEAEATTPGRLQYMTLRVLSRVETPAEEAVLSALVQAQLALYGNDLAAADALIHVGDSEPPAALDPAELAAWTLVANTLLNLDEALTNDTPQKIARRSQNLPPPGDGGARRDRPVVPALGARGRRGTRSAGASFCAEGAPRHLVVHGGRAISARPVRLQTRACRALRSGSAGFGAQRAAADGDDGRAGSVPDRAEPLRLPARRSVGSG